MVRRPQFVLVTAKTQPDRYPTAQWTGQQIIEAFPWDTAPKYLLRDRDAIYGSQFQKRVQSMGVEEVFSAPRSPWQNAFVERIIGSIRRDCLDHVVVLKDRHLKRILTSYFNYFITGAHIYRWEWIVLSRDRCSHQTLER
jgi:transposase InsO family protein